jgi:hypothetical protein
MRNGLLVGATVILVLGLIWVLLTPTFTIIKPFVAPASPSSTAVTKASPAPTSSFPLEAQVVTRGHGTRNFTVSMELRTSATAPPVSFNAASLSISGNTVSGVATRPNTYLFVNTDAVKMTWLGEYQVFPGWWLPFSKTATVRFPAFIVSNLFIPSRGSKVYTIGLTPTMDFPVTIDLVPHGVTLSASSVTIPAGSTTPASVTVTAPLLLCKDVPSAVPGGTCIGGWMDVSSKFGGTAVVVTQRACTSIICEGPR